MQPRTNFCLELSGSTVSESETPAASFVCHTAPISALNNATPVDGCSIDLLLSTYVLLGVAFDNSGDLRQWIHVAQRAKIAGHHGSGVHDFLVRGPPANQATECQHSGGGVFTQSSALVLSA